ncbi:YjfB family protein [Aquibacillus rhizosphaerae]|uniref:YjfB family protein n=1 Tax=Aquibacillus rhizosphaerae TaxID=3051431 RepID=A0ABT7L3Q8_9BACI|nr:YjfB family protein [Aquibacillus sp. LR5S19]MDL4839226.1 YjfB family protein [Aquibacillus sp. LR5S19]
MDVAQMSMALSQGQVKQQASLSVMKKVMNQSQGSADFLNEMMGGANAQTLQQVAQPHLGSNIDIKG